MLQKLQIQNYAIIDVLKINFSNKLNIITGETGAGKSILMGALDLVLGKRADIAVLKNKEQKCIVEASFTIAKKEAVKTFFEENDLDNETEIIIRREIAPNGKSRSFVNDTPVNLTQLKELANHLVDLHRQFDTLEIGTENFQREVIDALADNGTLLAELKNIFEKYTAAKNELENLKLQQASADKEADYNKFLLEEFTEVNLQENELENLDAEIKLLSNAENIKQNLQAVNDALSNGEEPIAQSLKSITQKLHAVKEYHAAIEDLQKRLVAAQIEVQDIADELESVNDSIAYDAARIEVVNERLSLGYKLQKKHGVNSTSQLLEIQETLQQKLDAVFNITNAIDKVENEVAKYFAEANTVAKKISTNRKKQINALEENVNKLLFQIGMPNAQIKVEVNPVALHVHGCDAIQFLFDANKSNRFEPLHKVASGGELSRLMLAVKSLVAKKLQLPVLIFDEIDTGISGEAAKQVGIIMKDLSTSHQLISITHQPQIAAKADAHYFVYKQIENDAIKTSVRLLNNDERITAIAQMLGGEKPTNAALANAKEMMN
jgi:DNA repair protein RecN (Recombination protein N)